MGYSRNINHEICEDYIFCGDVKIILLKYLLPHQSTYPLVSCLFLSLCFLYSFPMAGICKQRKFILQESLNIVIGEIRQDTLPSTYLYQLCQTSNMKKINEYSHIVYSPLLSGRVQKTEMRFGPEIQVGLNRSRVGQWAFPEKARLGSFTEMIFNILWLGQENVLLHQPACAKSQIAIALIKRSK